MGAENEFDIQCPKRVCNIKQYKNKLDGRGYCTWKEYLKSPAAFPKLSTTGAINHTYDVEAIWRKFQYAQTEYKIIEDLTNKTKLLELEDKIIHLIKEHGKNKTYFAKLPPPTTINTYNVKGCVGRR